MFITSFLLEDIICEYISFSFNLKSLCVLIFLMFIILIMHTIHISIDKVVG